jgi:Tol biopolymer transport system component
LISWKDKADEPTKLFWVSVENGKKQRITSPPPGTFGDTYLRISPDGRTIAFVRYKGPALGSNGGTGDLCALPLTSDLFPGGDARQLTFDNGSLVEMAWTADSREIVFSSSRGGSAALWRMSASGSEKPRRLEVGENAIRLGISGPTKRLVYEQVVPSNSNIWRIKLSEAGPAAHRLIGSTRSQTDPHYSPDGKRITFHSSRSGGDEIWVCDADGSNPVQLTARGTSGSPRWSPDGRLIAFDSPVDGHWQIFVMDADGRNPRQLTHSVQDYRPRWSRDGRWIYFASTRTGRDEIWKMPAGGGNAIQLTRNGGINPVEVERVRRSTMIRTGRS